MPELLDQEEEVILPRPRPLARMKARLYAWAQRLAAPTACPDCHATLEEMAAVAAGLERALGVPETQTVCPDCGYHRESRLAIRDVDTTF
jgi:ribosomal protein L32